MESVWFHEDIPYPIISISHHIPSTKGVSCGGEGEDSVEGVCVVVLSSEMRTDTPLRHSIQSHTHTHTHI